jgi:hypothetical protein
MPANKKGKKSGGATPKKKASAPQHAAQREQRQQGRATASARRSAKTISQSRYPGETPLSGEDRPATRAGDKRGKGSSRKRTARKRTMR